MAKQNERFAGPQGHENDGVEHNGDGRSRPWTEARSGMLKAVVWKNHVGDGATYTSTQLTRLYKDKNDQWQETNSLGRDDLLRAARLLQRVFDQIEDDARGHRRD